MPLLLNQNAEALMLHPSNYRSTTVGPDLSHLLQQRYRIKDTHMNKTKILIEKELDLHHL